MQLASLSAAPPTERPARSTRPWSDTLRVLHVINGEDYSGAERVQDLLALRLPGEGFQVEFVCLKPGCFASVRQAQDVPLHLLPMGSRFDLRPLRRLVQLIRRQRYDLVHTHSPRNVLLGGPAARWAGVPLVHHVHCQTSVDVRQRWLAHASALVEKHIVRQAAAIVPVSNSCRDYLLDRGYPAERVRLVPNGVPSGEQPVLKPRGQQWTLGVVAMFRPRKGIEVLLRALAMLRGQGLPVRLRAVGRFQTADFERQVRGLEQSLGLQQHVDWVGFQRDVPAELARVDLLVLPSVVAEAMPMAVLEAMAAGVPFVGTRVPGVTDLIRDGQDGLLADPGDPDALAGQIARLVTGSVSWQALCRSARQRQVEHFSETAMAAGIAQVYRSVLAGCRARPRQTVLTRGGA